MNIKVLFFGKVREMVGNSSKNLDVSDNYTLRELVNLINTEYSVLSELPIIYSRNNEYMYSLDISLNNGDIIGFIPPISGG